MAYTELNYSNDPWGNPEFYIQKIGDQFCIINPAGLIVKDFRTLEAAQNYLDLETA